MTLLSTALRHPPARSHPKKSQYLRPQSSRLPFLGSRLQGLRQPFDGPSKVQIEAKVVIRGCWVGSPFPQGSRSGSKLKQSHQAPPALDFSQLISKSRPSRLSAPPSYFPPFSYGCGFRLGQTGLGNSNVAGIKQAKRVGAQSSGVCSTLPPSQAHSCCVQCLRYQHPEQCLAPTSLPNTHLLGEQQNERRKRWRSGDSRIQWHCTSYGGRSLKTWI